MNKISKYFNDVNHIKSLSSDEINEFFSEKFGVDNVYEKVSNHVDNVLQIMSKYDLDKIEDELVIFYDELFHWNKKCIFALNNRNGSTVNISFFNRKKEEIIVYLLKRLLIPDRLRDSNIYEWEPCLYISFYSKDDNDDVYFLDKIDEIVDRIMKMFKRVYGLCDIKADFLGDERHLRKYNTDFEVDDYNIIVYLK